MENASKALMIAGSVLIALIIIGALVLMFNQLSELEQTKVGIEEENKITEYSKKFEQFNKTIYGSELLSLANLQDNYTRTQVNEKGYMKIDIKVKLKSSIESYINTDISTNDKLYLNSGETDISNFVTSIIKRGSDGVTATSSIESDINYYEKKTYKGKTVRQYSQMSNREIATIFDIAYSSDEPDYEIGDRLVTEKDTKKLMKDIENYKNISTTYVEFKNKRFKCTEVEYDQNGRLNKMIFNEI